MSLAVVGQLTYTFSDSAAFDELLADAEAAPGITVVSSDAMAKTITLDIDTQS
ncbi:MAG: VCBS domain-containing protein [Gallionella sp.]|jgi:VCBS repeat-containing protein